MQMRKEFYFSFVLLFAVRHVECFQGLSHRSNVVDTATRHFRIKAFPLQQSHKPRHHYAQIATTKVSRKSSTLYMADPKLEADGTNGLKLPQPKVYPERWIQLGYLSLLALLSDWICFSVAAAPGVYEAVYPGHSAAALIDIFLFTNVVSSFLVTDSVRNFGLEKCIKFASVLMAVGCFLRSGITPLMQLLSLKGMPLDAGGMPLDAGVAAGMGDAAMTALNSPFSLVLAGTVCVGAAQPFFQCTPPLLSAVWFGSDERATSTAVALNFNQIGIATAFLVGGTMATSQDGLAYYFTLIAILTSVVTAGTLLQFKNKPPTPPSTSEMEKEMKGEEEPPFIDSVKKFFSTPGFTRPLAAFICSISITNVVGAFIDEVMTRGGVTDQLGIDLAGAGFELAILLGGIIIGGYVDRTKKYKDVTLSCLLFSLVALIPLGLTEHEIGQQPVLLVASLLGLGMGLGPVQPINAELAVDVTYPSDETAVESVQQIGGNLISALLVPLADMAAKQDYTLLRGNPQLETDIRGDVILLSFVAIVTIFFFRTFDAPLRRTIADCGDDNSCARPELNRETVDVLSTVIEDRLDKINK